MTIMKYKYPKLEVPYKDLDNMYDSIIVTKDEIETYIINNCINIISKFFINKNEIDKYLLLACEYVHLSMVIFFRTRCRYTLIR